MEKSSIPKHSASTASRMVGDEAVILLLDKQLSLVLNDTGAFIWENCDGKKNLEEIAATLAENFQVTAEEAMRDCRDFINQMLRKEILQIVNP